MRTEILLIEDEEELRINLIEMLELNGFEVFSAVNGIEGLKVLQSKDIDLVISDIMMPIMDGYEMLEVVRANPRWANLPFLFLSAKVAQKDIRRGMELGAEDYLYKPVLMKDLLNAIQAALSKKQQRQIFIQENVKEALKWERNVKYHELRTPLSGIMTIIDYMKAFPDIEDDEKSYFLHKLEQAGNRLNTSLLKLNRLYDLQVDPLNKIKIISIKTELENYIESHGSNFTIIGGDLSMYFDREHFDFILDELLGNAIKFKVEGETPRIYLTPESILICNRQNLANYPTILEPKPFMQLNRNQKEQQGLGLGLYLISEYVKKNGYHFHAFLDQDENFNVKISI